MGRPKKKLTLVEQRTAAGRARMAQLGPRQRRALAKKAAAAVSPQAAKERAGKAGRAAQAKLTPAERRRRAKLAWRTRRAKAADLAA